MMSSFTTGQLAQKAGISVRTLQFYDQKGLLIPSDKSSGGRRIYNDADLKRLKLIMVLKNLGISLNSIKEILESDHSIEIMRLILIEQEKSLQASINTSNQQLKSIQQLQKELPELTNVSINTIDDINLIMDNKKSLRRVHINLFLFGIPMDIIELITLIYAIRVGNWLPFIISLIIILILAGVLSRYYFRKTQYICPNCNTVFKPSFWKMFWSKHTPKTRKLTCPNCHQTEYCVEIFDDNKKDA